jgi:hypothetical protein
MSYKRLDKCAAKAAPWQMRCRLLEHDDVTGAIKRYGGRARPLGQEFCDLYTPPTPATGLTATFDPELREIKATWVNGSTAALVGVLVQKDACARHDIPFGIPIGPVTPGTPGEDVEYVGDDSGPHCVSVMTYDAEARVGPIASVWIDVPPQ